MKVVLNREMLYLESKLKDIVSESKSESQVKWINDLLKGSHHDLTYQHFVDMRTDIEDVEFLKRCYYYKTPTGKIEIQNRLKLCIQFYSDNIPFMYQYPMMIVTNTRSLFIRRHKRIKKIKAEVGSSDQTEQKVDQNDQKYQLSSDFLVDLSRSSIGREESSDTSFFSYQSDQYHIYDQCIAEQQKYESPRLLKLKEINESELSHLISGNKTLSNMRIESQIPTNSRNRLHSIQYQGKSTMQSNISIVPIDQKLSIGSKKSGMLSTYLDFVLDKQLSYRGLGFALDNPTVKQYSSVQILGGSQQIQKERQQRAGRRQKIREKAEQLLKRVSRNEDPELRY